MELPQESLEHLSVEELSSMHAALDREIAELREQQGLLHSIQTEKEQEAERARAAHPSLAQKVG